MILFCIALPQEMKVIKKEVKNFSGNTNIDFLLTGVGNLNTLYGVKDYIQKNGKPDFIVNMGVCGRIGNTQNDFFQVYRIKNLSNNKEALCPTYIDIEKKYSLGCSESILTSEEQMKGEVFVDMESFAIDYICEKERIPYIILKKPFDMVSTESKKVDIRELEASLASYDYKKLLDAIQTFLTQNPKAEMFDVEYIKQEKRLTFSEGVLLKKYINKCIAFGENISDIFSRIEALEKKEIEKIIK